MPVNISVTKRYVKNKTGLDVSVTSHTSASSPKLVKDYHVVVITRLPFFKQPQHSETDTVQFMVCRDYSSFEKLQKDILLAFPELKFPNLPRKYLLFMNESDIEERMVSFDCIVKIIARDKDMFTSPAMLNFLGFDLLADKKYFKARREYLQKMEVEAEDLKKFGEEAQDDHGLFGGASSDVLFSDDSQTSSQPFSVDSIFEEEKEDKKSIKKKSAKISVMEDDDAVLFHIEKHASSQGNHKVTSYVEDNSELLNVTDSLDDVLKIIQDDKKSKVKKVMASLDSPSMGKGRGLFDVDEEAAADMGKDDIMKYIEQNEQASTGDDLDLF